MDIYLNATINGDNTDYTEYDITATETKILIKGAMAYISQELIEDYINNGYNDFSIDITVRKEN